MTFLSTPSARRATRGPEPPFMGGRISIHALREEGDELFYDAQEAYSIFLSTPSARRATAYTVAAFPAIFISIHALREEGDVQDFITARRSEDFYPRPPRGGRPKGITRQYLIHIISIHALREEGDLGIGGQLSEEEQFLSTPSARRATWRRTMTLASILFLSTPSARRATAKTETKSLFSNKLYNILHEFRRALIYNGSKSYPNHAK